MSARAANRHDKSESAFADNLRLFLLPKGKEGLFYARMRDYRTKITKIVGNGLTEGPGMEYFDLNLT